MLQMRSVAGFGLVAVSATKMRFIAPLDWQLESLYTSIRRTAQL